MHSFVFKVLRETSNNVALRTLPEKQKSQTSVFSMATLCTKNCIDCATHTCYQTLYAVLGDGIPFVHDGFGELLTVPNLTSNVIHFGRPECGLSATDRVLRYFRARFMIMCREQPHSTGYIQKRQSNVAYPYPFDVQRPTHVPF